MRAPRDGAYLIYDALLFLAGVLLLPWVAVRALFSREFRKHLPGRLGYAPDMQAAPRRILIHGVSVGEVKAARPLILALEEAHPECELVVCSTTPSGRETARRIFPELVVVTYPLDLPGACRRFLARVKPTSVVILELEIWPNFLRACNRQDVPVAIANGRITERSMSGYLRVQRLLPQFDRIRMYGVQNERYAERFRQLAVPHEAIVITGNLKYDNLPTADDAAAYLQTPWPTWIGERPAIALGSTHPGEEEAFFSAAAGVPAIEEAIVIVVPRHPRRAERLLAELQRQCPDRPVMLRSLQPEDAELPAGTVLVVDSFGELESVYRACSVAYVGGSLVQHGGQNVLEPAALARPIAVGPHTENFAEEVTWLAEAGGLQRAIDAAELVEFLTQWLGDPVAAKAVGQAAHAALSTRRGGAAATLHALEQAGLVPPPAP